MPSNNDPIAIIQNARERLNRLQSSRQQALGRIQTHMEQLQQAYGILSVERARARMSVLDRKITRLRTEFQNKYNQLIQEHPWVNE